MRHNFASNIRHDLHKWQRNVHNVSNFLCSETLHSVLLPKSFRYINHCSDGAQHDAPSPADYFYYYFTYLQILLVPRCSIVIQGQSSNICTNSIRLTHCATFIYSYIHTSCDHVWQSSSGTCDCLFAVFDMKHALTSTHSRHERSLYPQTPDWSAHLTEMFNQWQKRTKKKKKTHTKHASVIKRNTWMSVISVRFRPTFKAAHCDKPFIWLSKQRSANVGKTVTGDLHKKWKTESVRDDGTLIATGVCGVNP